MRGGLPVQPPQMSGRLAKRQAGLRFWECSLWARRSRAMTSRRRSPRAPQTSGARAMATSTDLEKAAGGGGNSRREREGPSEQETETALQHYRERQAVIEAVVTAASGGTVRRQRTAAEAIFRLDDVSGRIAGLSKGSPRSSHCFARKV